MPIVEQEPYEIKINIQSQNGITDSKQQSAPEFNHSIKNNLKNI